MNKSNTATVTNNKTLRLILKDVKKKRKVTPQSLFNAIIKYCPEIELEYKELENFKEESSFQEAYQFGLSMANTLFQWIQENHQDNPEEVQAYKQMVMTIVSLNTKVDIYDLMIHHLEHKLYQTILENSHLKQECDRLKEYVGEEKIEYIPPKNIQPPTFKRKGPRKTLKQQTEIYKKLMTLDLSNIPPIQQINL